MTWISTKDSHSEFIVGRKNKNAQRGIKKCSKSLPQFLKTLKIPHKTKLSKNLENMGLVAYFSELEPISLADISEFDSVKMIF